MMRGWAQRRAMATATLHTERLPDLDYDYGALEPYISGEIMKLHHQTYITNFNKALEQLESSNDPAAIVALQSASISMAEGTLTTPFFGRILRLPMREEAHLLKEALQKPLMLIGGVWIN